MKNLLLIIAVVFGISFANAGNGNGGNEKKAAILHVMNNKMITIGLPAVEAHLRNHAGDEMMVLFEGVWYTETEFQEMLDGGLGDNDNGNGNGNASRDDD